MGSRPGYQRERLYGINEDRFRAMLARQSYGCAICGRAFGILRINRPNVDHDHRCCRGGGEPTCGNCVRGLLCHACNVALGWYENRRTGIDEYLKENDPLSLDLLYYSDDAA